MSFRTRDFPGRSHLAFLVLAALLLSAPLVLLVPPGEAPDEPAHVAYVHQLVSKGSLPPVDGAAEEFSYELYQPPLAYLAMAAAVRAAGFRGVAYPFAPDPSFAFQRGARAFRPLPPSEKVSTARRALLIARAVNLGWLALAVTAILLICRRFTDSPWFALAAAAPFALAPQWLFTGAVVGNDAAVTALVAWSTFGLILVVSRAGPPLVPIMASTAAGLALWAKPSAVVIAPAVSLSLLWLIASRRWRDATLLLLPGLALAAGWVWLEVVRTGSILPDPQTGWHGGSGAARLVTEPWWMVSAWIGFWAKLGWFNLPLPAPVYLVFVAPTVAAVLGGVVLCRPATSTRAGWLLATVLAANVALLVLYMVQVDWQPQGRYLLPAAAAAAGLATLGIDRLGSSWSGNAKRRLAFASCSVAVMTALLTLVVVGSNYS